MPPKQSPKEQGVRSGSSLLWQKPKPSQVSGCVHSPANWSPHIVPGSEKPVSMQMPWEHSWRASHSGCGPPHILPSNSLLGWQEPAPSQVSGIVHSPVEGSPHGTPKFANPLSVQTPPWHVSWFEHSAGEPLQAVPSLTLLERQTPAPLQVSGAVQALATALPQLVPAPRFDQSRGSAAWQPSQALAGLTELTE